MKKLVLFLALVTSVLATGCIRSLNPLCEYEDMTIDDRIIGKWEYQSDKMDGVIPRNIEIGRACRPIYEKYKTYINNEGKLDSNHTIISYELTSSENYHVSEKDGLKFIKLDSLNYYYITFQNEEEIDGNIVVSGTYFKIALTELNGLIYFDLVHKEDPGAHNDMTGYNIPAHYLGVIDVSEDKIDFTLSLIHI